MTDADSKQRFLFPDSDIRGEILRLEASLAPVLQSRDYPLSVQGLLSEAMAAAMLMASTLKFQGRLALQAQGSGPVTLLMAEASDQGEVRGLARFDDDTHFEGEQPGLQQLLGDGGLMAITIRPHQGQQYQGVVPIDSPSLSGCLEHYFKQSEQLDTRLWLAAGNGRAAGLLLQRLPDRLADRAHNDEVWQHLQVLADTLTMEELLDLPAQTVLHRLFHEQPHELPPAQPLRFACTCSRQRVRHTLLSLGATELQGILDDIGEAVISCDFCGHGETFDAVDLAQLIHEARQQ